MHTYKSISIIFKYIRGMFIKLLTTLLPMQIIQIENNYLFVDIFKECYLQDRFGALDFAYDTFFLFHTLLFIQNQK